MDAKNIYYLTTKDNKNEPVYNKFGNLIGYFTGFSTRPTHKEPGTIQIDATGVSTTYNSATLWVYGDAVYIVGFGFKFVGDFEVEQLTF